MWHVGIAVKIVWVKKYVVRNMLLYIKYSLTAHVTLEVGCFEWLA